MTASAFSHPLEIMFMPMASPVVPGETGCGVERVAHNLAPLLLDPPLGRGSARDVRELDARPAGHTVLRNDSDGAATCIDGLAPTSCGSDEATLGGGHWDMDRLSVDVYWPGDAHGDGHVPDDVLAAGAYDLGVVVALIREQAALEGFCAGPAGNHGATYEDSAFKIPKDLLEGVRGDFSDIGEKENLVVDEGRGTKVGILEDRNAIFHAAAFVRDGDRLRLRRGLDYGFEGGNSEVLLLLGEFLGRANGDGGGMGDVCDMGNGLL
ncbi:hypothetical protein BC938DRAFT_471862 [Jimgerdemannia flammicorona]|uniref:Uncharacterized protein n=1 Tax=Jimgerdemannia flammicorona TaxID=994334 RepID=A0A433QUE0_9FUNG|nr:hypothetical protein BC938DRAFT_471862 [Jimgerdemannia flammicorona]